VENVATQYSCYLKTAKTFTGLSPWSQSTASRRSLPQLLVPLQANIPPGLKPLLQQNTKRQLWSNKPFQHLTTKSFFITPISCGNKNGRTRFQPTAVSCRQDPGVTP